MEGGFGDLAIRRFSWIGVDEIDIVKGTLHRWLGLCAHDASALNSSSPSLPTNPELLLVPFRSVRLLDLATLDDCGEIRDLAG
jgi:hypothetical protein